MKKINTKDIVLILFLLISLFFANNIVLFSSILIMSLLLIVKKSGFINIEDSKFDYSLLILFCVVNIGYFIALNENIFHISANIFICYIMSLFCLNMKLKDRIRLMYIGMPLVFMLFSLNETILMYVYTLIFLIVFIYFANKSLKKLIIIAACLFIALITNNVMNEFISQKADPDWTDKLSAISETSIGNSDISKVRMKNRVMFTAVGDMPNSKKMPNLISNILAETENNEILWMGYTPELSFNYIDHLKHAVSQKEYYVTTTEKAEFIETKKYTYNYMIDKVLIDRFFIREQKIYSNKEDLMEILKGQNQVVNKYFQDNGFLQLINLLRNDNKINYKKFNVKFLNKQAINKDKKIIVKFKQGMIKEKPYMVESVSVLNNRKVVLTNGYEDAIIQKDTQIKFNYLDSIYKMYSNPTFGDKFVYQKYSKTIKKVIKEMGIDQKNDSIDLKVYKVHLWFARNFSYTLDKRFERRQRTIEDFLLYDRKGHCEYFATATALILRELGIPSKYVTGYNLTEKDGVIIGNLRNAHAWNLYYDGAGWKEVDNTVGNSIDSNSFIFSFLKLNFNVDTEMLSFKFKNIIPDIKLDNIFKDSKIADKMNTYYLLIVPIIIILLMIFAFIIRKINIEKKATDYYLKKKLKKVLLKYPKNEFKPWMTWAKEINDEFAINEVKKYYKKIYGEE